MFFSKPETYSPCGIFSIGHLILFLFTTVGISIAVKHTKADKKEDITQIIKKVTIVVWILEIMKIIYNISIGEGKNLNKVIPLYYCSLLLYSGALSSFAKGMLKKIGDVFLATGRNNRWICFYVISNYFVTKLSNVSFYKFS